MVDSRGVVTAAWTATSGNAAVVMAARLGAGGWRRPAVVMSVPDPDAYLGISMTVGPDDRVVIAAFAESSTGVRLSAVRSVGAGWSPAAVLGDYPDAASPVRHVYGLATVADSTGVSVLWQVMPDDSRTTAFVARGLPSGAVDWTAPTVLDGAATGTFAAVRDGRDTVRVAWQHGPDVVSAQGSTLGWGPRETIGPSGNDAPDRHPYPDTYASAATDGTVLVAWTQPQEQLASDCPTTLAALRTASGWTPALPLPAMGYVYHCVGEITPALRPGAPPVVIGVTGDRFGDVSHASVWTGSAWGPDQQTRGRPYVAGSDLLAIDLQQANRPTGPRPEYHWLTASTLTASGWSPARRVSDATGGWAGEPVGAARPDGSFVLAYAKRNPWRAISIWSADYAGGRWSPARRVAPAVRVPAGSRGAVLADPVTDPRGRTTLAWVLGSRIRAGSTTG
jgi:hypothetical protein